MHKAQNRASHSGICVILISSVLSASYSTWTKYYLRSIEIKCMHTGNLPSGNVIHLSPWGSNTMTLLVSVKHDKYTLVNEIIYYIIAYFKQEINNKYIILKVNG